MANANNTSYYVYLHRKKSNGQVFYVGKGKKDRAFKSINRTNHWRNVVAKHGYEVELYATGLQEWYALELEIQLISYYGRENLCNLTDGGEGMSNPSDETRIKLRDARIGYVMSENSKDKVRKAQSKKVICSNGMLFDSCVDAANWLKKIGFKNPKYGHISSACLGKVKNLYGYAWSYEIENGAPLIKERETTGKTLMCVESGMIFKSMRHASEWVSDNMKIKASGSNISACITGKTKTAYGHHWKLI